MAVVDGQRPHGHQLGHIGVERVIAPGVDGSQVIAQRRQAVPAAHLVQRLRVQREGDRSCGIEQSLRHGQTQNAGHRQIGDGIRDVGVGTPVGIDQRRVRNPGNGSADRQRQPEVAHDEVRLDLPEQREIVLDVGGERPGVVQRLASSQCLLEPGRGNGSDGMERKAERRLELGVAGIGGDNDAMPRRIERLRQGHDPREMGKGDRFRHEQDDRPASGLHYTRSPESKTIAWSPCCIMPDAIFPAGRSVPAATMLRG
jgi:hypothetical protein